MEINQLNKGLEEYDSPAEKHINSFFPFFFFFFFFYCILKSVTLLKISQNLLFETAGPDKKKIHPIQVEWSFLKN